MPEEPQIELAAGEEFIHDNPAGTGYGHSARGEELSAEMTMLDLKNGAVVQYMEDDDAGWHLVSWVDDLGIGRITAIEPDYFASNFTRV